MSVHLKANKHLSSRSLDLEQSCQSYFHRKIDVYLSTTVTLFKLAVVTTLKQSQWRNTVDLPFGYELFTWLTLVRNIRHDFSFSVYTRFKCLHLYSNKPLIYLQQLSYAVARWWWRWWQGVRLGKKFQSRHPDGKNAANFIGVACFSFSLMSHDFYMNSICYNYWWKYSDWWLVPVLLSPVG